jgi:hypothetical protein
VRKIKSIFRGSDMATPHWMSLTRRISLLFGIAILSAGFAAAQSSPSTAPTGAGVSAPTESSSSDSQFLADDGGGAPALSAAALALEPAAGGAGGAAAAGQEYGAQHGYFHWSRVAGNFGGGFNAPIGNDTSSAGTNSTTYAGPFLTYGGNFTGGLGLRFSPRFSLLGEYQFMDDKLPGKFIALVGTEGGNAHIWSLTLDPVVDLFPKSVNSVYVTGGGGFYRKLTSFTDVVEGEECYYYCYTVGENETLYHFSSNQGGFNVGLGYTHRLGGTYGDGQMKLYAEARYVWIDTPPLSSFDGTGRTEVIPVTLGLRF